ncbi:RNA 3'-terminal phosphate cyclase [Trematosphaeria pertusa]|uniref:RNA 3'-terminal phosphate cyclase n=1 Tax=Trematosphaeria pertusa TaxID=390896 RepID=A0A6A6IPN8_9PLEO|nr:RNA 3'-terminal phosphate cyclase [Trematosphaeria pertusa]KAF2251762.1 RNA 3'-terminal phosphate cyclase [Trematosphaeria pertusa]
MASPSPIHLEGTTLEGGGQLLRLATCLSALTSTPLRITNIRGKRSGGGGLKAQHLTSIQFLSQASNARLSGAGLKSKEITFLPGRKGLRSSWEGGEVVIKQNTPGSVNLVLQAILPYLLFAGGRDGDAKIGVSITGGTNVSNSPSYEYVDQVLFPMLALIGIPPIEAELHSRGWSTGSTRLGGVTYTIAPLTKRLPAFQLTERGDIKSIRATILAPRACEQHFREELDAMFDKRSTHIFGQRDPDSEVTFEDSHHDKRFYLLLVATTTTGMKLGRDWLYDHGVRSGKIDRVVSSVVKKVFDDLIAEIDHGGCVDEHLRDQLVVFQSLAEGKSRVFGGKRKGGLVKPSLHAKTAHWVANEIVGVQFDEEGSCAGTGICVGGEEEEVEQKVDEDLVKGLEKLEVVA